MHGKVKFFNLVKGYGFITGDDSKDYFFHVSDVEGGSLNSESIQKDTEVEFETEPNPKGAKAVKIKLLK